MAHKTLISGTAYEVKGGKCLVNGTSYDIKKGRTLINGTGEDIVFSSVSPILDENDWTTIREVSDAGQGSNYWSVGDRKEVTLNGTVGHLSLSALTIMQASRAQTASIFSLQRPRSLAVRTCVSAIINMGRIADGWPRVRAISL